MGMLSIMALRAGASVRRALVVAAAGFCALATHCARFGQTTDDAVHAGDAAGGDANASVATAGDAAEGGGDGCPSGRGPAMLRIDVAAPFCIDTTEVTRAQYKTFLDSAPPITA